MRIPRAAVLALGFVFSLPLAGRPIHLARHPDYHDGKIVFAYRGDLWVVREDGNDPRRLTVHPAHDGHPRFSPDGKWIAFSSNRYGNDDVFVIPSGGGEPKRLTFHSAADTVVGWSPDSTKVVFSSARGKLYPGIPNLYEVAITGGLEQPLPTDWGFSGSYSPDGKHFAFNRHPATWWRKHYRGSFAADLWIVDLQGKKFRMLLDADLPDREKPNNFWPMWGNGEIYFVSDRQTRAPAGSKEVMKSANNIWKIPAGGGAPVQVTHHADGSLFWPSLSSDGRVLVYEEGFGLWKLDTKSGKTAEVKIEIDSDLSRNDPEVVVSHNEADEYDLSPSTKRAVVSFRGELFTIATDRGDVSRVTRTSARESRPEWSPDGRRIAFVTDSSGRDEVAVVDVDGKNFKRLSDAETEKLALAWSPDSKSLAYTSSDKKLHVVDVADGKVRTLASSDVSAPQAPRWSPDGKWISYTKADADLRPHVHLVAASGGEERTIPDDFLFSSGGARWTPDGKRLVFLGGYVQGGAASLRDNRASVYSVWLGKEERDPMSRDIDDEKAAEAAEKAAQERSRDRGRAGVAADPKDVRIEWAGFEQRIRPVTRLADNITTVVPSPDGRVYAFVTVSDAEGRPSYAIWTVQENGDELRRVFQTTTEEQDPDAPGGAPVQGITSVAFSKDGRTIYFREGNGLWSVSLPGGSSSGGEGGGAQAAAPSASSRGESSRRRINFTLRMEINRDAEEKQVFAEAWRVMKNRFYDPAMHGADWAKVRERYEALLPDVADREDLHDLVSMMIGELNSSHQGISGGAGEETAAVRTRFPGFELAPDTSGYYRIAHVYRRGPAERDYVRLTAGDFLLAVDGMPLKSGDNYYALYEQAAGRRLELTVNSKPSSEGAWTTRVDTVGATQNATLQYEKWVEDRRKMVDRMSGGTIGYVHIRQMNAASLRRFERDLADNHFKKALVIDQRFNPGGGIDQELLAILSQKQYQYTRVRDSVYLTRPQRAFFGPMVVMQNERSTSDAEVFPAGFRRLKLGKTVGTTTYGAVIGTGAYRLMDGSNLRTPGSGLWDVEGQNLENYGVPPDISVDNPPADTLVGGDAQLARAVEVLQQELKAGASGAITGAR